MPRYHLHCHCDGQVARDEEGTELPTAQAAYNEAVVGIRDIVAADLTKSGTVNLCGKIEIVDERGDLVKTLSFADAIQIVRDTEL